MKIIRFLALSLVWFSSQAANATDASSPSTSIHNTTIGVNVGAWHHGYEETKFGIDAVANITADTQSNANGLKVDVFASQMLENPFVGADWIGERQKVQLSAYVARSTTQSWETSLTGSSANSLLNIDGVLVNTRWANSIWTAYNSFTELGADVGLASGENGLFSPYVGLAYRMREQDYRLAALFTGTSTLRDSMIEGKMSSHSGGLALGGSIHHEFGDGWSIEAQPRLYVMATTSRMKLLQDRYDVSGGTNFRTLKLTDKRAHLTYSPALSAQIGRQFGPFYLGVNANADYKYGVAYMDLSQTQGHVSHINTHGKAFSISGSVSLSTEF